MTQDDQNEAMEGDPPHRIADAPLCPCLAMFCLNERRLYDVMAAL